MCLGYIQAVRELTHLGSVLGVVHHQELELCDVVDEELLEAAWEQVAGFLVATVPDVGHQDLSTELSAND